jgi:hypothetical protein
MPIYISEEEHRRQLETERAYRKEFRREIQKMCTRLVREAGFTKVKRMQLVKECNGLLQIVVFDSPPSGIRRSIAFQPLYFPFECITLACAYESQGIDASGRRWGKVLGKMEDDIDDIERGVYEFALPLFENIDAPEAFIRFLSGDIAPFYADHKHTYFFIALSHLILENYEKGKEYLLKTEEILNAPWCNDIYLENICSSFLEKLRAGQYDAIQTQLKEYIQFSRKHIGLPVES